MSDNDHDLLVPPDQGPSAEAAGGDKPASEPAQASDPAQHGELHETDASTGPSDGGEVAEPTSGDVQTPGEVRGEGNAGGLTQGIDQG